MAPLKGLLPPRLNDGIRQVRVQRVLCGVHLLGSGCPGSNMDILLLILDVTQEYSPELSHHAWVPVTLRWYENALIKFSNTKSWEQSEQV